MTRTLTTAIAAVLAFTVAALPVILDRCATTCEARQDVSTTPVCHHASDSETQVAPLPVACGHDHGETVVTTAKNVDAGGRPALHALDAVNVALADRFASASRRLLAGQSPPGLPSSFASVSAPLRI